MTTLAEALAPRSDQLNADDLIPGPRVLKITAARIVKDGRDSKVVLNYEGDQGKPWKPCKTMGRAMVMAWAITDESQMVGKSVRVYRDPEVKFGDQGAVGGIRISHMSDIAKPVTIKLTVSQGKKGTFTFNPLVTAAASPANGAITAPNAKAWVLEFTARAKACTDVDQINALVINNQVWLDKLPDLLRADCDTAVSERLVELMPGRDVSQMGDQFPGDDDGFGD